MNQEVATFLDDINEMLESGRYEWARPTLSGIYGTVRRTQRVSSGQRTAVMNIRAGRREDLFPSDVRRGSRRYEGWTPNKD